MKVALIHGYSDKGPSFRIWAGKLRDRGIEAADINICNYISLNNEITIPDIAEGLGRAMKDLGWGEDEKFDAVVHSTGMLVIRAFLCNNAVRPKNLRHLVGLAPATWGSPLAHKGRSFLGSLFRGNHQFGPDFLEAGNIVLKQLELGSEFTWNLAHRDMLCPDPIFSSSDTSPFVACFVGNQPYSGIRELINQPATDGTVRWAGCALNTSKYVADLRRGIEEKDRFAALPWAETREAIPVYALEGKNHATILTTPDDDLVDRVVKFLAVNTKAEFDAWSKDTAAHCAPALQKMKVDKGQPIDGWQQFVFHVVDEYGDPVPDYVVDLFKGDPTRLKNEQLEAVAMPDFDLDVHAYEPDKSFRCFHVRLPLGVVANGAGSLWMRLTASSGTELIAYQGYGPNAAELTETSPVVLDLTAAANGTNSLFLPFTTTLVEIKIHREPIPFQGQSRLMTMKLFTI